MVCEGKKEAEGLMIYKSLMKTKILFVLLLTFIILGNCQYNKTVAYKVQKLTNEYNTKKSQGYDMSEVDVTLRLLKKAKEKGDRPQFTRLLERLEKQLHEARPPSVQPHLSEAQTVTGETSLGIISLDKGPWPMYCHDPRHTCRSPYQGLTVQPTKPKWKFSSPGGHGISSPVSIGNDGKLYVGTWKNEHFTENKMKGHSGMLCSLFPDGTMKWKHDSHRGSLLASGVESAPLLTSDGKVIYGKDDGHVYALDLKGTLQWDFSCDDPFKPEKPFDDNEQVIPSPVLGPDGTLYVCSHWGNVYNPRVMKELSKKVPIIKKFGIKAVKKPLWGKVYAIDVRTGSRKWTYDPSLDPPFNKKVILGSPAIGDDGTVYFGAYDGESFQGYLYALNPNGTKKWRFPKNNKDKIYALQSSPSIGSDGTIYIGSFGNKKKAKLYAVNPNGTLKWSYEIAENRITSTPGIGPDGTIYVGSHNWGFLFNPTMSTKGHLYAIKDLRDKARLKWKFEVDYGIIAPPAIDKQGNIFFGTNGDPSIKRLRTYYVYALNNKGEKLWSYPLKGRIYSPPVIDKDGTIYVGTTLEDKRVYAFGPQSK